MHLEGLLNVLGHFGGHFSSLGAPYGLMLPLLGHLLASFLRSWGVLGRLFGPSWAKLSQDDPRWRKKTRFLRLTSGSWTKLGPENREKSMSKAMFFSSVFLTSIFINFQWILDSENRRFFGRFFNLKRKRGFCENCSFPIGKP